MFTPGCALGVMRVPGAGPFEAKHPCAGRGGMGERRLRGRAPARTAAALADQPRTPWEGHTGAVTIRFDHAAVEAAEARGDWVTAIAMVSEFAECYSADAYRHNAHLWHMDLLVKARLLRELGNRADIDVHARRRLDRFLYEEARDRELRNRAERGDKTALYLLVHLLRDRRGHQAAMQAVSDIDVTDTYAIELAHRPQANG
jgi:hypothetical protein